MAEFWSLTPRQIHLVFRGESERLKQEADLKANLASWQIWRLAHFMRAKTLPRKPDDLTKKKAKGTGPDWKMQKAAIELLNAAIGGFDSRPEGKTKGA